ncbi:MAG: DUF1993 domain-containing protein [Deltaproteobacteria bacterium]|nr:DUF1993 domain-containing protein [Deltaproteobacteria bacterium]
MNTTYELTVPVFKKHLAALRAILDKAQVYASERNFDSAKFLELRLAVDMLPFTSQVTIACDLAKNGAGRLANVERPSFDGGEKTLAELQGRIDKTLAFLDTLAEASFDGVETREITFPIGGKETTMSGLDYARTFALPNFFFHCTTTYTLLRHAGVALGKRDFLSA